MKDERLRDVKIIAADKKRFERMISNELVR